MVNKKDNHDFMPAVAVSPGETIRENMGFLGMNQKELAARLDVTEKHLSNILNGNSPITYDTALKMESVIGPSAQFWMNLESRYQLNKARLEKEEDLKADLEILKKIPYKDMSDHRWVEKETNRNQRVLNCREFFGVAKLSSVKPAYAVAFRQQKELKDISDFGVLAWIRKSEIEGLSVEVEKFDKSKLRKSIPAFRELTMKSPEDFYPEMKRMCAECGVALVLTKYIPKTYICGATIWRNNKAIIALSMRGKRADVFWFTFFHELAHLLNHSRKDFHISYEKGSDEDAADDIASHYLISKKQYQSFVENYSYADKDEIVNYANKIGIAPCILVGRLQHDGLIDYQNYNQLIPSFEIENFLHRHVDESLN
ncbi:MAG: HigA family addiction module antidote protein [Clostridiales bacterium]|jgi:HTH-type transcriptional regulator/antitoxin HigA|nr:HigA family addiction module antidote protein [Clostridiales bacterium]